MNKKIAAVLPLLLVAASCGFFGNKPVAGLVKTVNGGSDWQFVNLLKEGKGSLSGANVFRLAFDPSNRQVVYAGTANGGLYRSEESGDNWTNILSNISVYDFQIHPQDNQTLYAAGLFNGHGRVLISKDGGKSWNQIYNDAGSDNPVRAIALNPQNPSQVVIGLASGSLIKSFDGGISWKLVKDFDGRINRLLWQQSGLYMLIRESGLYKSTDAGETFAQLTSSVDPKKPGSLDVVGSRSYNQFFVDSIAPSLLYVTTSQGLLKTVDEGKTWATLQLPVKEGDNVTRAIALAKNSSNTVFTSIGSTIYKSTDGGTTWQTRKVATTGILNYILVDPELPQIAYAGIYGAE